MYTYMYVYIFVHTYIYKLKAITTDYVQICYLSYQAVRLKKKNLK